MPDMLIWIAWLLGAYLLGAVSFALILGRLNGINIREHGSGNVGATNLGRALGKKWGIICFRLDLGKGLGPVLAYGFWSGLIAAGEEPIGYVEMLKWLAVGVAAGSPAHPSEAGDFFFVRRRRRRRRKQPWRQAWRR